MSRLIALTLAAGLAAGSAVAAEPAAWSVPDIEKLPPDKYGELVRYGRDLVMSTSTYIGPEVKDAKMRFAGNNLACKSCHLDNGAKQFSMPFVGVHAAFPQYRGREDEISTIEDRVNGCMERSMNGKKLPLESREMKAYMAYMHFLSTGVPVGGRVEGQGAKKIALPNRAADPIAGKAVYAETCASCHGEDGQGVRNGKPGDAMGYQYPPLWGKDTFNDGAGMARLITAAQFIRSNMPLGTTHDAPVLTNEQAYDVSAYLQSQKRPMKANLDRDFPARLNKPVDAAFPPYIDGMPADQHKYGPFQPLIDAQKALQKLKAN